jgi:hypothetical protein
MYCSAEIVAADRLVERVHLARRCRHARSAFGWCDALGLDERAQDRQGQIRVPRLDVLIKPVWKLTFARQRAVPFAVVVSDAADLPEWQLEIDERQRHIGPGSRVDQLFNPRRFGGLSWSRKTAAGKIHHLGEELRRYRVGIPKPVTKDGGIKVFGKKHWHRLAHACGRDGRSLTNKMIKTAFENEVGRGDQI